MRNLISALLISNVLVQAADLRGLVGTWNSLPQYDGRPQVTLRIVWKDHQPVASLRMLGLTHNGQDDATLDAALRNIRWTGAALKFELVVPGDAGKSEWELKPDVNGFARLTLLSDNGVPAHEPPIFPMKQVRKRRFRGTGL